MLFEGGVLQESHPDDLRTPTRFVLRSFSDDDPPGKPRAKVTLRVTLPEVEAHNYTGNYTGHSHDANCPVGDTVPAASQDGQRPRVRASHSRSRDGPGPPRGTFNAVR